MDQTSCTCQGLLSSSFQLSVWERRVAAEKPRSPSLEASWPVLCLCSNVPLGCLRGPPLCLPWPFRICIVHKGLTVFFIQRQEKKCHIEMSLHSLPHCHSFLTWREEIQRNWTALFAGGTLQESPRAKNCRKSPPSLLQLPNKHLSRAGLLLWSLQMVFISKVMWTLDSGYSTGNSLLQTTLKVQPQVPTQHNSVHRNLLEKPRKLILLFLLQNTTSNVSVVLLQALPLLGAKIEKKCPLFTRTL